MEEHQPKSNVDSAVRTKRKIKRENLLDPKYISLDFIRYNDPTYNAIFNKYGLKTFADLEAEIANFNLDIMTNGKLLYENYKVKNYIDIPLKYISISGLFCVKHIEAEALLERYAIVDFEELDEKFQEGNPEFISNIYLSSALSYVKSLIKPEEKENDNKPKKYPTKDPKFLAKLHASKKRVRE